MKHAIVIGGSMAGLLCARVLSDSCERVTILERDCFPEGVAHRRGVPQGRHAHGLLASGREILERLFPGITDELASSGAVRGDIVNDSRWFLSGGCLQKAPSDLTGILASRPFIESAVRRRVLGLARVQVRENTIAEGLRWTGTPPRVTAVRLAGETLEADLVIDATGRGSHSPQWLEEMGYERPLELKVEVSVAYTTRHFRRRPEHMNGDVAAIIPADPEGKRGGVMLAQEGDRWVVTLIGYFGNVAPSDLAGFVSYAATLPASYIHDVIREAEPLDEPQGARFAASLRRRYDKLERFPDGLLVVGDALCSFNPIYGQGMSVAALEANALAETLQRGSRNLARRFFQQAAKAVDVPWDIVVGNDLRMKETVGERTVGVRFINWYLSKLHKAAHRDPVPALAFHRVGNLLAPPPSILHPRIAGRVLAGNLRRSSAPKTGPDALSRQTPIG